MARKAPLYLLLGIFTLWMVIAVPQLADRWSAGSARSAQFEGLSIDERLSLLEHPGFSVARTIARAVPPEECVLILARTSAAGLDFYRTRFPYLLYPRRVEISPDSSTALNDCDSLAVFRDAPRNLQGQLAGAWDEADLQVRLNAFNEAGGDSFVRLYHPASPSQP